jgi:hypothetical protein
MILMILKLNKMGGTAKVEVGAGALGVEVARREQQLVPRPVPPRGAALCLLLLLGLAAAAGCSLLCPTTPLVGFPLVLGGAPVVVFASVAVASAVAPPLVISPLLCILTTTTTPAAAATAAPCRCRPARGGRPRAPTLTTVVATATAIWRGRVHLRSLYSRVAERAKNSQHKFQ